MTAKAEVFTPPQGIHVDDISPLSMATFLQESQPSLKFENLTYPQIFSELRGLPFEEQEKLLVDFYSQEVESFPNGAELGRFLAKINQISWSQPKSPPNLESLESLSRQALSRLNLPDLTLRTTEEEWNAARGAAWNAVFSTAQYAARVEAWDAAWNAVRGAAWDTDFGTARNLVLGAEWIVVKDLMPQRGYNKGNPLEPLVEIYELGCLPTWIVPD